MKTLIRATSCFILIFLFSGCSKPLNGLSSREEADIHRLLRIKQPKLRKKCKKIPIYKEPNIAYCTKEMSKDECLIYMAKKSWDIRYQLRKQIKVCRAINLRQNNVE